MTIWDWQWRDAAVLWWLVVPFVWGLWVFWRRRQQQAAYADPHLMPWVKASGESAASVAQSSPLTRPGGFVTRLFAMGVNGLQRLFHPAVLLTLAWMALVVALAGPRSLVPTPEASSRAGVDVLVALDASRSMLAQDVKPNRFLQARALVASLAKRLEPDDRLGLMVFAGRPHLVSPLSFDRDLFEHYLALVRPGILPTRGSEVADALAFGLKHLQQTAGSARILLLFTNGKTPDETLQAPSETVKKALKKAVDWAKQTNTQVVLVGVGSSVPTPIPTLEHPSGTLYVHGKQVRTQLQTAELKRLAAEFNGDFRVAEASADFLDGLLAQIAQQAGERSLMRTQPQWQDHARPFIVVALAALLLSFYPLSWRRKSARNQRKAAGANATRMVFILVVGAMSLSLWPNHQAWAKADSDLTRVGLAQQAYDALVSEAYDRAQQLYIELGGYEGLFGAGAAAYRNEDYESSVAYFREAAILGWTPTQRAQALFNLGNSFYQAGLLALAIESYEQALAYQPDYDNAKHNLALAKRAQPTPRGEQQQDEDGEGQGEGQSSRDADGAFYGGQKPNQDEVGEGASGDAPEGEKDGREFVLPESPEEADFSLQPAQPIRLGDTANAILDQQQRVRRIEAFEQEMQAVDDQQSRLLQTLFEREEGFQATQDEPHALPGVKPW